MALPLLSGLQAEPNIHFKKIKTIIYYLTRRKKKLKTLLVMLFMKPSTKIVQIMAPGSGVKALLCELI